MKNIKTKFIPVPSQIFCVFMAICVFLEGSFLFYTQAKAALTAYEASVPSVLAEVAPSNLVANNSVEIASNIANVPLGWTKQVTGRNTTVFTYPSAGFEGSRGMKIDMSKRITGNAKWVFNPVNVSSNTQYVFNTYTRSNVLTYVYGTFTLKSGKTTTLLLGTIAKNTAWKKKEIAFRTPLNTTKATIFVELSSNGYLESDFYYFNLANIPVQTPGPTSNPTTQPSSTPNPTNAPSSTPSPTVAPTATPTPTVVPTATPTVTPTPTVVPTVTHSPTPVVTPTPTATPTVVPTVTPTPSPTPTVTPTVTPSPTPTVTPTPTVVPTATPTPVANNLILNPSMETATNPSLPDHWFHDSWGTNTVSYTYPVAGFTGNAASKVSMTAHTDGDAKWYFEDVAVTGNKDYVFSDSYNSTVPTSLIAQYTLADHSTVYSSLAQFEATAGTWKSANVSFSTPVNAVSMTVFHLIQEVGELTTDNYSLQAVDLNENDKFSQGIVSLTFDDGWLSQYQNALPILNSYNMKGSFYIVSQLTLDANGSNLVPNQSLETDGGAGDPASWHRGNWGTNTAVFTFPATGSNGANGAKIDMSGYTDGDAKWYFDDATITGSTSYHFRDSYLATVPTQITARFTLSDNSVSYQDLATVPAGASWQNADLTFTSPANAVSVTLFHLINSNGSLTIDDVTLAKTQDYMTPSQVLELQTQGHEVGSHTRTHQDLTTLSAAQAQDEIAGAKQDLLGMGITSVSTMAYPYGAHNSTIDSIAATANLIAGRSVTPGYDTKSSPKFGLVGQSVEAVTTFADVKAWIDTAVANKTWLVLIFHGISNNPSVPEYGASPETMEQIAKYLHDQNVSVMTVKDVLPLMN